MVFQSFQADNLKRLDLDTYFSLQELDREADVPLPRQAVLPPEPLGVRPQGVRLRAHRAEPQLRRRPRSRRSSSPALEELEADRVLGALCARRSGTPKAGRGLWQIVLVQASRRRPSGPRPAPPEVGRAVRTGGRAHRRGVTPATAAELVRDYPAERIRQKLEVFDWLRREEGQAGHAEPAGYLVKSIQDDYAAPKGFETKADRAKREEAKREQQRQEAEAKRRQKEAEAREQAIHAKVTKHWNSLTPAEQQKLDAEVLERAEESFAKSYRELAETKNPIAKSFLKVIRDAHIRRLLKLDDSPTVAE